MPSFKISLDFELDYSEDFTVPYIDYLESKNVLTYFWANNLGAFDSEPDAITAFAEFIVCFTQCTDVIENVADLLLAYNGLPYEPRLIEALSEEIRDPFVSWVDGADFIDVAREYLGDSDLKPLIKGLFKRKLLKNHS